MYKNKEDNIIKMDHLGRPDEYSLPLSFSAQKLAVLVSSKAHMLDMYKPGLSETVPSCSANDLPFLSVRLSPQRLLSGENIHQTEFSF